jgi:hypothetical protein
MRPEQRLRTRIEREAASMAPDVAGRLEATLQEGRRRGKRQQIRTLLAFAAVILAVVLVGPPLIDALRDAPYVGVGPSPSPPAALSGTYGTALLSTDGAVTANQMQGDWTIGFQASEILTVTTPPGFTGTYSGYSFEVAGSQITTDLFGEDVCSSLLPGVYRWTLSDNRLTFSVEDDSCPGRVALLTSSAWTTIAAR